MPERLSGCTGKRKYATRELADAVNAEMIARGRGKKLHPYLCPHCGCWHHSHLTPEENGRLKAETRAYRARWTGGRSAS